MDAIAAHNTARGVPDLAVQWGAWSSTGRQSLSGADLLQAAADADLQHFRTVPEHKTKSNDPSPAGIESDAVDGNDSQAL